MEYAQKGTFGRRSSSLGWVSDLTGEGAVAAHWEMKKLTRGPWQSLLAVTGQQESTLWGTGEPRLMAGHRESGHHDEHETWGVVMRA